MVIVWASASLAALPVVGALAADGYVDTITVTVEPSCSIATTGEDLDPASTYTAMLTNGESNTNIIGSTFTVTCNDYRGWEMYAVGSGNGSTVAVMDASTGADDDIATGTTLDGTVSNWAFKVAGANGADIQGGYDKFSMIPTTKVKIAKGDTVTTTAKVTATYGVGISSTQEAGTYTGKVTYSLAQPATY